MARDMPQPVRGLLSNCGVARVVVWLYSLAAVAALCGTGIDNEMPCDNEMPSAFVSAESREYPALAQSDESPQLRPGKRSLASSFEAVLHRIKTWFSSKEDVMNSTDLELDRRLQIGTEFPCRPSRRPAIYGVILSTPPEWITECAKIPSQDIFGVNHQIVDISFGKFGGLEALMISQRRGPVQYIEVVTQGDYAHYDVNRNPLKTFRDHSCLNRDQWCFVAQVKPVDYGLLVVDRHRVILYNYTWLVEGSTAAADIPDVYVSHFGLMNSDDAGATNNSKLKFPTAVAEYLPYNGSLVSLEDPSLAGVSGAHFEITPLIPHAWCRLLFVTDTGNHRVMMLNASNVGQFDYLGQYGMTGEARNDKHGFDWPWGIAVRSPAWEGRYEPAYANVFVVDRRNHRLVKLNLGYPLMPCENFASYQTGPLEYDQETGTPMCRRFDQPRLTYSAEYGRGENEYNRKKGLTDPTAVAIYKHFIVVAEVGGNAITLLRIDHQPPFGFKFVSYFKPMAGNNMQGSMAMSPFGYVWYNYIGEDMKFYFSSMFLPEQLRESKSPSRFQDFLETCVNTTWYQELIGDRARYVDHIGFILNASVINWVDPDAPGFVDIDLFNVTSSFDIDALNWLVYNGTMKMCDPPTTPTPPPFFGGNADGWVIDGKSQSEFTKRSGAQSSHVGVGLITCCIWILLVRRY